MGALPGQCQDARVWLGPRSARVWLGPAPRPARPRARPGPAPGPAPRPARPRARLIVSDMTRATAARVGVD
ncbi:hypothetical protein AB0C07_19890, partial [Actinoplanes missouriensis]|uniref:hypothetical protein n=1 Tax=Actinoplanes missouriensis TaxID=1866 RepID=UPI0033F86335